MEVTLKVMLMDIDIVVLADKKDFLGKLGAYEALEYLENLRVQISNNFQKDVDICDFYLEEKIQNSKIVK